MLPDTSTTKTTFCALACTLNIRIIVPPSRPMPLAISAAPLPASSAAFFITSSRFLPSVGTGAVGLMWKADGAAAVITVIGGARTFGEGGVNSVGVTCTASGFGGCAAGSVVTSTPPGGSKSDCWATCWMSTTLPPMMTRTTCSSAEKVKNRACARRNCSRRRNGFLSDGEGVFIGG